MTVNRLTGSYISNGNVYAGNPFNQFLPDAVLDPLGGRLQRATSFTVVASYLHYWSPEWRSAIYGSYGEIGFGNGIRYNTGLANTLVGAGPTVAPPSPLADPLGYALSPALRDTGQIAVGASLIWSPVKDLDIGIEGQYTRTAVAIGRVADSDKAVFVAGVPTRTVSSEAAHSTSLSRMPVQASSGAPQAERRFVTGKLAPCIACRRPTEGGRCCPHAQSYVARECVRTTFRRFAS
ncbi:hypothetical protein [Methylorubrum thiocyanatum]|uniref:hypothetical protein n=1 Tax=Methylorubrum thiocyanatum TaxID=47958 RepID=UPI00398C7118